MAVLGEEDRELPRAQRIEGLRLIVEETDILPGIEFAQRLAQVGTPSSSWIPGSIVSQSVEAMKPKAFSRRGLTG